MPDPIDLLFVKIGGESSFSNSVHSRYNTRLLKSLDAGSFSTSPADLPSLELNSRAKKEGFHISSMGRNGANRASTKKSTASHRLSASDSTSYAAGRNKISRTQISASSRRGWHSGSEASATPQYASALNAAKEQDARAFDAGRCFLGHAGTPVLVSLDML
ncbi:hypothetical protein DL93DRAFT_725941 [Clavulina sp. PMI_390]|nr:hypothetical protein DL93DRAFT_725941 [Clavulina sp. PMI_390]